MPVGLALLMAANDRESFPRFPPSAEEAQSLFSVLPS